MFSLLCGKRLVVDPNDLTGLFFMTIVSYFDGMHEVTIFFYALWITPFNNLPYFYCPYDLKFCYEDVSEMIETSYIYFIIIINLKS